MKKYFQLVALLVVFCNLSVTAKSQTSAVLTSNNLPHTFTFEAGTDDSSYFSFANGNDGWFFGSATSQAGTQSLYISNDNGMSNAYRNPDVISYAWITMDISEAGAYEISFDWKSVGSDDIDFMYLYLAPNSVAPTANTPLSGATQIGSRFGRHHLWQNFDTVIYFSVSDTGVYKLIFKWSTGNNLTFVNPPIAIDNLYLNKYTCPVPTKLVFRGLTSSRATATWSPGGGETSWNVYLDGAMVNGGPVTDTSCTFYGLDADTEHEVRVYANCGGNNISRVLYGTFRTFCDSYTEPPYHTSFEEYPMGSLPECWCPIQRGTGTVRDRGVVFPAIWRDNLKSHNGNASLAFKSSRGEPETFVLPAMQNIYELQLTFFASSPDTNFLLEVGIIEEDTSGSRVSIVIDTVHVISSPSSNPLYYFYRIPFNIFEGVDGRIFLRTTCQYQDEAYLLFIDDLRVDPVDHPVLKPFIPAAISVVIDTPITIQDTLLSGTDVSYQWTSNMYDFGDADITEFGTDSAIFTYYAPGIDTLTLVASSAIGSDTQALVIYVIDSTPVNSFPYSTSFENGQDISWTLSGEKIGWYIGSAVAHNGNHAVYISGSNGTTTEASAWGTCISTLSRKFHFSQIGDYTLRFSYMGDGMLCGFFVRGNITPYDIDSVCFANLHASSWSSFATNLHVSDTGTYTLIFQWQSYGILNESFVFAIDDIGISLCNCDAVSSLSVSNITANEADVYWTSNNNESQWWISIDNETSYSIFDDSIHLSGLSSHSWHTISVSAICAPGDTSLPISRTFITDYTCHRVTRLSIKNVTETTATVKWSPGGDETEWIIVINSIDTIHVSDTVYTITGLSPLTDYYLQVFADCGSGDISIVNSCGFQTPCGAPNCDITIQMYDSQGDGWGGGCIALKQSRYYDVFTLEYGFHDTRTMSVCPNLPIVVTVYVGPSSGAEEMSATIINGAGIPVFSFADHTLTYDNHRDTLAVIYAPCTFCIPPDSIRVISSSDTTLTIAWNPYSESDNVIVSFDGGPWQPLTSNTYTATGLNANTDYIFAIRSLCPPDDTSIARTIVVHTTGETSSIRNDIQTTYSLHPNPANDRVLLSGPAVGAHLLLLDINGRILGRFVVNKSNYEIVISNYPRGTYFLRIVDTHNLSTIKLIVD